MFVTNWISTTKIQKISEITNFFRHYFLSRTEVIYYYSKENSQLELDFVIQAGIQVIPVEVKAEENLQSKSLKATIAKYPGMKGLRFSMSDYREHDGITNVPLYGARGYLATYI